jgi:hypothetical protein
MGLFKFGKKNDSQNPRLGFYIGKEMYEDMKKLV